MSAEHQLLDVTDRMRRSVQHGAVFAGVIVGLFTFRCRLTVQLAEPVQ